VKVGPRFKRDPKNNRPRYSGLEPRAKGPPGLAVVAGGGTRHRSTAPAGVSTGASEVASKHGQAPNGKPCSISGLRL